MNGPWMVVVLAGAATMLLKAAGPVLVGGRELPARLIRLVNCLAPALFAALIVTQAFGGDHAVRVDERAIGLAAGVTAVWLRAPIVVAVVAAAAVTAVARQLT